MTHFTSTTTPATTTPRQDQDAPQAAARRDGKPVELPRRQRLGSAIASVVVTTVLIGSVVFGMGSMADDAPQIAGAAVAAHQA